MRGKDFCCGSFLNYFNRKPTYRTFRYDSLIFHQERSKFVLLVICFICTLIWICIFLWYLNSNGIVSYCAKNVRQATHHSDSASCMEGTLQNIHQTLSRKTEINNERLQFSVLFGVKLKVKSNQRANLSLEIYSIRLHKLNCDSPAVSEGNIQSIPTVHSPWTLHRWWELEYNQAAKCKCAITATCHWLISHPKA